MPVILQGGEDLLGVRVDQLGPGFPERVDNVADEANLGLLCGGVVPVTHGGDVQPGLPLLVPLQEELLCDSLHPDAVDLQGLGGVGEVAAVDHVLQHLDPVIVVVQEQHPATSNLLGLHHRLEVRQQTHVLAHVGGQDHVNHHLPHTQPLLLG